MKKTKLPFYRFSQKVKYHLGRVLSFSSLPFLLSGGMQSCETFNPEYVVTIKYDPVEMPGIDMWLVNKYLSEGFYDKVVIVMIPNEDSRYFSTDKWHTVTNNLLDVYVAGNGCQHVGSHGEVIVKKIIPETSRDSIGIRYEDARLLECHYITITEREK
ncbi:MAG: hypothetical protein K5912_02655 [Alphaproteobacteria bacterium]|nr:hypothetical protein [Alphaproteobacteria bacterium]